MNDSLSQEDIDAILTAVQDTPSGGGGGGGSSDFGGGGGFGDLASFIGGGGGGGGDFSKPLRKAKVKIYDFKRPDNF